jgi:hypothetical protein
VALEEPIGRSRHARGDYTEMNPRDVGCDVMDLVEVPEEPSGVYCCNKIAGNFSSYPTIGFSKTTLESV